MLEKEDLKQIEIIINTSLEPMKQQLEGLEPMKRQLDRMEFGLKEIKVELKRYIELREKRRLLHIKAMSI